MATLFAAPAISAEVAKPAEHVVVVVMDGLRPDSVIEQDMPTLYKLAHEGTTFANHHSVYPSSTEVNGTALATGGSPGHDGIMSNKEYRPDIEMLKPIAMEDVDAVRKGDQVSNGRYLNMPTVAEILRAKGLSTVVAGTKPIALLLDRSNRSAEQGRTSVDVFQGTGIPTNVLDTSTPPGHKTEQFPEVADPTKSANRQQDAWTTRVLIDHLWAGKVPAFTMFWMSEPDYAQHGSGPGSDVAKDALRSDDDNLAKVLQTLDAAHVRDTTDVLVVSDHGFSTISRTVNVTKTLKEAGFDAGKEFSDKPADGQILVVPNGGSTSIYVVGHNPDLVQRLVTFLQTSDFAGVIFTKTGLKGTFTLDAAGIDTPAAPDIIISMRWSDEKSKTNMPGMLVGSAVKYGPGQGYHASLSRFDMHNTLIASGPNFRHGLVDTLPSGNSDVAPTVLHLLGVMPDQAMDGRILSESIVGEKATDDKAVTTTLEAAQDVGSRTWHQYLTITKLGTASYCDEGNGNVTVK